MKKSIKVDHIIKPGRGAAYIYGIRPDDGARRPEDVPSGQVADFLMRHPEVETKSYKIRRCLAFLEQFSTGAAPGRSARPTVTGADAQ